MPPVETSAEQNKQRSEPNKHSGACSTIYKIPESKVNADNPDRLSGTKMFLTNPSVTVRSPFSTHLII